MKKSLLILAAATAVGFAACTGGGNKEGSYTQEQLDSIIKAKDDSTANALKMQSDSIANAQNARAVDSLKRINDSLTAVTSKPTTAPATPNKKPTRPAKGNGTKEPVPVNPTPQPVDKGSNTYRPGAKNSSSNTGSGTESSAPKSNSDRPGAK